MERDDPTVIFATQDTYKDVPIPGSNKTRRVLVARKGQRITRATGSVVKSDQGRMVVADRDVYEDVPVPGTNATRKRLVVRRGDRIDVESAHRYGLRAVESDPPPPVETK